MIITAPNCRPIVALIAGILILIIPRLLNIIVAIYLIITAWSGSTPSTTSSISD